MGAGSRGTAGAAGGDAGVVRSRLHQGAIGLILLLAALALPALAVMAQEGQEGAQVFQQNCAACHQANGAGVPGAFPPLAGNPNASDPEYVADVIRNGRQGPIEVAGQTYDSVMPAITTLTDAQIASVAAYVADLSSRPPTTPTTGPAGPVVGNVVTGESLFLGRLRLGGGGAACAGCHSAGEFGGASLGPDLTTAFSRLGGKAGLEGWLANPPSPTMTPIFSKRPLQADEIAHLVAYLESVDGSPVDRGPDVMLLGGVAGLAVLFGGMTLFFKRPRGRYVDHLRSTR
jgi:ubiquinol-cytochrome c reductase cytochrome c subunit